MKMLNNVVTRAVVNRAVILVAGLAGGFIVSEWPTVHNAMCEPVQYYERVE